MNLIKAADEVCLMCYYRSEKQCEKCPVRKTIDRLLKGEIL